MHVFLAAIKANWPQHMHGQRDEFFLEKKVKKKSYNGLLPDFFEFLPVFDQFKHEEKSVLSIIESQLGLRPVGDMKAKLRPCLGVSGSLTWFVVRA